MNQVLLLWRSLPNELTSWMPWQNISKEKAHSPIGSNLVSTQRQNIGLLRCADSCCSCPYLFAPRLNPVGSYGQKSRRLPIWPKQRMICCPLFLPLEKRRNMAKVLEDGKRKKKGDMRAKKKREEKKREEREGEKKEKKDFSSFLFCPMMLFFPLSLSLFLSVCMKR